MKNLKLLAALFIFSALLMSCSDDDDELPPVNEEELITTMTVTLAPNGGGTNVILKTVDLDGDGPNPPVITVSGPMTSGVTYMGSIELLNETEDPAEDITEEVEEEAEEHQIFYTIAGGLDAKTEYENFDSDGNPLGTEFSLDAGDASTGTLTFTLRHEPKKPNDGLADAGGETDISATFPVEIE
ncbi:type 1 periplasmic binding fold superfamily protein [Lutimonas sp.]|uniref:type 1 periplasmic binding fold superfamily protein n=1 Tax=Lutimonas sp. TaxID=1872403 RepID=UPI003C777785